MEYKPVKVHPREKTWDPETRSRGVQAIHVTVAAEDAEQLKAILTKIYGFRKSSQYPLGKQMTFIRTTTTHLNDCSEIEQLKQGIYRDRQNNYLGEVMLTELSNSIQNVDSSP